MPEHLQKSIISHRVGVLKRAQRSSSVQYDDVNCDGKDLDKLWLNDITYICR